MRLKVIKSLLDAGVKLQTARQAIEYLREDLGDDWATANLVLDGTNSVLVRTDDMLIDVVRRGPGRAEHRPARARDGRARRRRAGARRRATRRVGGLTITPERCPTSRCASRTTPNDSSRSSSTSTPSSGSTSRARSCSSATATATRRRRSRPTSTCPAYDLYIEITTLNQKLVTKKNRKARRLRRAAPRDQDQGALPARLPAPAREVRPRAARPSSPTAPARRSSTCSRSSGRGAVPPRRARDASGLEAA